ncbi:bifunctional hydroxymethylpyrimidine kinase/phosphomethylpyrimidine kinase [Clostridium sp. BJN0013]|uniref:bifunctional hydroxymethylpyrimidine kinase/phosphomethylpyrimidine kinase n=1 Tax=Clostridium sp. BJN0013 TaxID=3236840 RepID=UPI0034C6D3F7
MKKVLTIAGSDSSGGAGIQADLKTMSALGVYGMSVITAVTAQNTMGVQAVMDVSPEIVESQIRAVFDDIEVDAVKIGMVSNSDTIFVIQKLLAEYKAKNIVLDPVMISKSGYFLLRPEAKQAIKDMVKIADVITPNIPEAEVLTGLKIESREDMERAAFKIKKLGAKSVLVKGGHRCNDADDILLYDGGILNLQGHKINTQNTHGTGCTLSSAIASYLAKGYSIDKCMLLSKEYITKAIENSFNLGRGVGPVGHLIEIYRKAGIDF